MHIFHVIIQVYLVKFGYLDREHQRSSYSSALSAQFFCDAIKNFQAFAGLKKMGYY
jgi:hypothetical protein